jgi:hypothetical protein
MMSKKKEMDTSEVDGRNTQRAKSGKGYKEETNKVILDHIRKIEIHNRKR